MAQTNLFQNNKTVTVPGGLKWSKEMAEKASEKNKFIRVGSGDKTSTRLLSGATRFWSGSDPEEIHSIFNTTYRITGTPEHIESALRYEDYSEDQIREAIADSITKDNYQTTKKDAYDEELKQHTSSKKSKPEHEGYTDEQWMWFADNLENATVESKKAQPKGKAEVTAATKPRVVNGSLKDRVDKLRDGELLDVSDMTDDWKSIKTKPIPKTNKSDKHYAKGLPFMSNDLEKYIKAVTHVYGSEGLVKHSDSIEEIRKSFQQGKTNGSSVSTIPSAKSTVPTPIVTKSEFPSAPKIDELQPPKIPTYGASGFPVIPSVK
jgi:hypothetical protein